MTHLTWDVPSLPLQLEEAVSLLQRQKEKPNLCALNIHFAQLRPFVIKFKLQDTDNKLLQQSTRTSQPSPPSPTPSLEVPRGVTAAPLYSPSLQTHANSHSTRTSPDKSHQTCTLLLAQLSARFPSPVGKYIRFTGLV